MAEDPKRLFVEMVARLSRETQLHIDERHHHLRITDTLVIGLSILLAVLAVVNVYFVHRLNNEFVGILNSMTDMNGSLTKVGNDMDLITQDVASFDAHMTRMDRISENTAEISVNMPTISRSMSKIGSEMRNIEGNMGLLSMGMTNVDARFGQMTGGVTNMRQSVNQMARPIGFMNNFVP